LEDISQWNLLRSPLLPLKLYQPAIFLAISRQIRVHTTCDQRFCKVLRQINAFMSNKWPL
ncbi:hypothetical protein T03_3794, partial [Trichinella britovi]